MAASTWLLPRISCPYAQMLLVLTVLCLCAQAGGDTGRRILQDAVEEIQQVRAAHPFQAVSRCTRLPALPSKRTRAREALHAIYVFYMPILAVLRSGLSTLSHGQGTASSCGRYLLLQSLPALFILQMDGLKHINFTKYQTALSDTQGGAAGTDQASDNAATSNLSGTVTLSGGDTVVGGTV